MADFTIGVFEKINNEMSTRRSTDDVMGRNSKQLYVYNTNVKIESSCNHKKQRKKNPCQNSKMHCDITKKKKFSLPISFILGYFLQQYSVFAENFTLCYPISNFTEYDYR